MAENVVLPADGKSLLGTDNTHPACTRRNTGNAIEFAVGSADCVLEVDLQDSAAARTALFVDGRQVNAVSAPPPIHTATAAGTARSTPIFLCTTPES